MEVRAKDIDLVDPWAVHYEVGTDDFVVVVGEDRFTPVFLYDRDGYPCDFEGWNPENESE